MARMFGAQDPPKALGSNSRERLWLPDAGLARMVNPWSMPVHLSRGPTPRPCAASAHLELLVFIAPEPLHGRDGVVARLGETGSSGVHRGQQADRLEGLLSHFILCA